MSACAGKAISTGPSVADPVDESSTPAPAGKADADPPEGRLAVPSGLGPPACAGRCGSYKWAAGNWACNGRLDGAPFQSAANTGAGHGVCLFYVRTLQDETFSPSRPITEADCRCGSDGALRCDYDWEGKRVELACRVAAR